MKHVMTAVVLFSVASACRPPPAEDPAFIAVSPESEIVCPGPLPPPSDQAHLSPWFYHRSTGELVIGRHQFHEDRSNTHWVIARDIVDPDRQDSGTYPDVVLFNYAHFDPADGVALLPGQTRRFLPGSVEDRGVQAFINYRNTNIEPGYSDKYPSPTWFASLDGPFTNYQTVPPVPAVGLGERYVSATRGAFGCISAAVPAHGSADCGDLYVTASLGYGLGQLDPDPDHQAVAAEAQTDRLFTWSDDDRRWFEVGRETCTNGIQRVPDSALLGNSSGVVFADLTGDGFADLYVGKTGDDYAGAANVLLVNDGSGCFVDETAARIPGEPARATTDVAAADLDGDGDLDLVVANRCPRTTCGTEAHNYALLNSPSGFALEELGGLARDSRSVSVGDLEGDGLPEVVYGNAGSRQYEKDITLPVAIDHPTEIYTASVSASGALSWIDEAPWTVQNEDLTTPQTHQVLVQDVMGPAGWGVLDGRPDLLVVNHRDTIKGSLILGSIGIVFRNDPHPVDPNEALLKPVVVVPVGLWGRAVALADFDDDGFLEVFAGNGSRFNGIQDLEVLKLNQGDPADKNYTSFGALSYDSYVGTEHGYGFDFADLNGDGWYDMFQTSRGYQYVALTRGEFDLGMDHVNVGHHDLGTGATHNFRGQLQPRGMEDGVFADFDGDGAIDLISASQRGPSFGYSVALHGVAVPETIVLANDGTGSFGFDITGDPFTSVDDARIDLGTRVTHPSLADRAVAGDIDNDGDIDAIVHLFPLPSGSVRQIIQPPAFPDPIDTYSFGWRYLENVVNEPGAGSLWFRDVAPTRMRNPAGNYDPVWNRGLGADVLSDFDNNGMLDLYTTVGFAVEAHEVETSTMTWDLVFMNGISATTPGTLTEMGSTLLPPPCQDVVAEGPDYVSCGSFGVAQGDVDNDGDADVVVSRHGQGGRTNYAWLLINNVGPNLTGTFTDEWGTRIGPLDDIIDTPDTDPTGAPTVDMDDAMFPGLLDLDADGDLDLVYQVTNDLPRILRNKGRDNNGDGVIDAADGPDVGTFEDATEELLQDRLKVTADAQDIQPVDLDQDGDWDFVVDPFNDMVTVWRNERFTDPDRPAVTDSWPRTGTKRGSQVTLEGVQLGNVLGVELRFAGGATCVQTQTQSSSQGRRLTFTIPAACPVGLAQVRVQRQKPCGQVFVSTQYFGYFVLE